MPALPPLAAVRAFEAAARLENFSRAAEELGLTQSGVSYQIRVLEDRLGTRLFAKQGRGVVLTDQGRRIAPRISESFALLEAAFASLRSESETQLAITASRTFATNLLAGWLGDFHLQRPELAVRLDVTDQLVDMEAGEFDAAVRGIVEPTPGMVCHFLMRQPVTPMATPAFLERHPVTSPRDLLRLPRISHHDEWWGVWFASLPDCLLVDVPESGIRLDSQVLDGHAALAGHGVAILNPVMFRGEIAEGRLVQIFPQVAFEPRSFWLVYPEHKRNLAKIRGLRDWLLRRVREAAGDDPHGVLVPPEGT